jgi:hypothetical protein
MLSRQAMRQNKAAVPIKPFMFLKVLAHLLCPSGASLHYAFCHTSCYSYSIRHGSYLCPFATLHSLRPTFRYHYTTFVPLQMLHFMASHLQAHKTITRREAHSISQSQRYNTHWVPLTLHYVLHSFQHSKVHPLPIILRALLACRSYGFVMVFDPQHKGLKESKNTRQTLAYNVSAYRRFTAL